MDTRNLLHSENCYKPINVGEYLQAQVEHIRGIDDSDLLAKLSQLGPFYGGMNAIEKALSDIRIHGNRYLSMIELLDSLNVGKVDTPLRILEIGCNTGFLSLFTKDLHPEYQVVALDRAPTQIEANLLIGSTYTHAVDFLTLEGSSVTEKLGHEQFDVVFLCEILEHLDHDSDLQHKVLRESLASIRQTGIVVITVPYEDRIPSPGHLTIFTRKMLHDLLKSEADNIMGLTNARKHFNLEKHLIFLAGKQPITPIIFEVNCAIFIKRWLSVCWKRFRLSTNI